MDKSIKWKVGIILVVLFFEAIWLLIMLYARSYGFEVEFNAGYILFALLILDTHLYAYILVKDLYYNKYSPIAFVFLLITSITFFNRNLFYGVEQEATFELMLFFIYTPYSNNSNILKWNKTMETKPKLKQNKHYIWHCKIRRIKEIYIYR